MVGGISRIKKDVNILFYQSQQLLKSLAPLDRGIIPILHIRNCVSQLPKGKTVEYTNNNRGKEFSIIIRRVSPMLPDH